MQLPTVEAAATEEATAEAVQETATEEATAEATGVEDAGAAAEKPEELPNTGLNLASGSSTLPIVVIVLGVLVVGAFMTRRRNE